MQETQVQFVGREDPLEKEMATHSSIPTWRIPWTVIHGMIQSMGFHGRLHSTGITRVGHDLATKSPPPHFGDPAMAL